MPTNKRPHSLTTPKSYTSNFSTRRFSTLGHLECFQNVGNEFPLTKDEEDHDMGRVPLPIFFLLSHLVLKQSDYYSALWSNGWASMVMVRAWMEEKNVWKYASNRWSSNLSCFPRGLSCLWLVGERGIAADNKRPGLFIC